MKYQSNFPTQPSTFAIRISQPATKNCKRACLSATADFADTKKLNLLMTDKNGMTELKNHLKPLKDKNAQLVTRYIKNWAESAKFQVCSSHLTLCGLTVNRSEMPNFSYTHPLCVI